MVDLTPRAAARDSFLTAHGWATAQRNAITGDASNRSYHRLARNDGSKAILMDAPPERGEDVHSFVDMAHYLRSIPLSAPEIYAADSRAGFLLIEDLGTDRFAEAMISDPTRTVPLYEAAADALNALHAAPVIDLPHCDAAWLLSALEPFFDWYAPHLPSEKKAACLAAFQPLLEDIAAEKPVVILRDFHAENLIWLADRTGVARVGLLDFQDALLGHPAYDLVSILQDARHDVAADTEAAIKDYFLTQSRHAPDAFDRAYAILGVQRNLRILGLFVRLSRQDGKPGYVAKIPRVWRYVMRGLSHPALASVAAALQDHLPEPTDDVLQRFRSHAP